MADDIVTRLRSEQRMALAPLHMSDAAAEIERLRDALQLIVDQLEEDFPKSAQHFAMVALGEHLKEARRG